MSELLAFQDAFVAALAGDGARLSPWLAASDGEAPGLAVYRNTITKGCVDALADNFPTVRLLVGEEWFTGAAVLFARECPPAHAALLDYGVAFPAWLARFEPAADLPYLAGLAHLDRLWTETLFAAEAPALEAAALASLAPDALATARVGLHPSLRLATFDAGVPGLWLAARAGEDALELAETPQTLLLIRRAGAVGSRIANEAEAAFLRACREGDTLGRAAERATEAEPTCSIASLFAALIADGAFSGLNLDPHA